MDDDRPELLTFAIIGNVLNFAYNIPFVWKVIKTKSAKDISSLFLYLRMFGSISWLAYSIIKPDILVGASYTVTLASSLIVYAVKTRSKLFDNPVEDEETDDETDNIEDNGLSKMITIESDI
jgi:uncharacterized protein with PQ loop repeat